MTFFKDSNSGDHRAARTGPQAGPEYLAFLALVRETAKLFRAFVPPDDFVPDAPLPPQTLPPAMLRQLGAPSLADFYSLALEEAPATEKRPAALPLFPEGPESIRPALICLEREIARLKMKIEQNRKEPGREKNIRLLDAYRDSRANLVRAARLWPKIKQEALRWPEEAAKLRQMAGRLEEGVGRVLKSFQYQADDEEADESLPGARPRASLTRAAADLKREVDGAGSLLAEKNRLAGRLEALRGDMEGLLAAAVEGGDGNRDWAEVKSGAERRYRSLQAEAARLEERVDESKITLSRALKNLSEIEERSAGRRDAPILRDRLEAALAGVSALLGSTLDRRRALAGLYFSLPGSLGRPSFLEKTHQVTAVTLGRTQSLLEETRHRLTLAMGRLSSTHQLRREGIAAAEGLAALQGSEALLEQGAGRLAALGRAIDQRLRFARILSQNVESEGELARTRLDNERLTRHIKTAALESERLSEQLAAARHGLGEMGRFKAKLLKAYAQKSAIFQTVEKARQDFLRENAELRAAKAELKRKRARLAAMYKLERGDLKRLSAEFDGQKDELALNRETLQAREAERGALEKRLESTRRERDELSAEQRELDAKARALEENLAASLTRSEALSAEINRLREELAKATRARQTLGERLSSVRRKLDLLARAQAALLKNSSRRSARLDAAENERDLYRAKLTRQNENILRLVTVRQKLRAELGHTSLRLADLEKEKNELFAQLTAQRLRADEAEKTGAVLGSRVSGLESENSRLLGRVGELSGEVVNLTETRLTLEGTVSAAEEQRAELGRRLAELEGQLENDLAPLIRILGEALYRSEAAHRRSKSEADAAMQNFRAESGLMMERMRLSADVREANIRLQAASRELDITEAAQNERRDMAATVSRLGLRHGKLRRALDILKQRYGGRLDEAQATEGGLRDLIDSQNRELKRQKRRLSELEPLMSHFLEQADMGRVADISLLRQMKSEASAMRAELGAPDDAPGGPLNAALLARLAELQPLVAFLAKAFVSGVADLAQARRERAALAEEIKRTEASRETLELSLDSRQGELSEMRDQAFELSRERDQLKNNLAERDSEILLLKTELAQADRDLAENDGRLEAAWAGLAYLEAKAGDNLAGMKARLENQTRQADKLSLELKNRNEQIRKLEDRQDKLALCYWTLLAKLMASDTQLEEISPLPEADIIEIKAEPVSEYIAPKDENEGPEPLDYDLLDVARKAARGGILTLLLAGGLLMGGPALAVESFHASPVENLRLSAGIESSFVGRPVSLDFIQSDIRKQGLAAVETRVKERVNEVARAHSLSPQEFLKLLRQARAPEALIHLDDFEGQAGVSALLAKHLPKLALDVKGRPEQLRDLLKAASGFRPGEGAFWERLYFNLAERLSRADSLEALLRLLDRKQDLAARLQPEFAGRLAPFPDVENMAAATFIKFMGGHIRYNWSLSGGRGRAALAQRLAGDIYFAARLHKLPPTLLSAITQWELEEGRARGLLDERGGTIFLYKKADETADLALAGGEVWRDGRAPLCDLDEILAGQYGQAGMENIFRKKMKIVMSYNKMISQNSSLF